MDEEMIWVVLRDHMDPIEASVIVNLLRASSIPVVVQEEAVNAAYHLRSGPLADVRLYVPMHRAAESEVLLRALSAEVVPPGDDEPQAGRHPEDEQGPEKA